MCGEIISKSRQKARKQYHCASNCDVPIPIGFEYIRTFEKDVGDVMISKWHPECREAFDGTLDNYGDDCMDPHLTWECSQPDELVAKYGKYKEQEP